ncbi:MAG: CYTH domain-containing protein [Magnetococcus sp. WYHC-3]
MSPPPLRLRQGFLSTDPHRVVRVREAGGQGWLTVKGLVRDLVRSEFEYPIPVEDARHMLETLCPPPLIDKRRYRLLQDGMVWEVDEFLGDNLGLVIAEVELPAARAPFVRPPWLADEVSEDVRFFNSHLARRPFCLWDAAERRQVLADGE